MLGRQNHSIDGEGQINITQVILTGNNKNVKQLVVVQSEGVSATLLHILLVKVNSLHCKMTLENHSLTPAALKR